MKGVFQFLAATAAAPLVMALAGCVATTTDFPLKQLPDHTGAIVPGRTDRAAVSNLLGKPYITSRDWGVALYRAADAQTEVEFFIVVPFAWQTDTIYRYTLVAYDLNGVVQSATTGVHRRPSAMRIATPLAYDHLTTELQAGEFIMVNQWEDRKETLLVNAARRDAYLERARSSTRCTVVIGCGTGECSSKLRVDGGPTLPLPCRLRVQNLDRTALELLMKGKRAEYEKAYPIKICDTVAVLSLTPGSHTLKAWGGRWQRGDQAGFCSGEQSITFSGRAGEIVYIVIDVSARSSCVWWGARDAEWKIDKHKDMPPFFADRPLVLYRGDRWLVSPEP